MEKSVIKSLLELSTSFDEADEILTQQVGLKDDSVKIGYLMGMFDCRIIGRNEENEHADYVALLTTIINQKWRG